MLSIDYKKVLKVSIDYLTNQLPLKIKKIESPFNMRRASMNTLTKL